MLMTPTKVFGRYFSTSEIEHQRYWSHRSLDRLPQARNHCVTGVLVFNLSWWSIGSSGLANPTDSRQYRPRPTFEFVSCLHCCVGHAWMEFTSPRFDFLHLNNKKIVGLPSICGFLPSGILVNSTSNHRYYFHPRVNSLQLTVPAARRYAPPPARRTRVKQVIVFRSQDDKIECTKRQSWGKPRLSATARIIHI